MEPMTRRFSRSTLIAATVLAAGMLLGAPAAPQAHADDLDSSMTLPPLPDIRTPDQVRWFERWRNRWVSQMEILHAKVAKAEARRNAREQKQRPIVKRRAQDPSTAAAVVQSQKGSPSSGSSVFPETIDGAALKPFNSGSKFYQDGSLVFQGKERTGIRTGASRGTGARRR